MRTPRALATLAYHDFRLIWAGQFVSTLGTQIQTVALGWLVYDLTGSEAQLGGIGLARAIPIILFSMFGGTLADRTDRRRLLFVSQGVLATLTAILATLVAFDWASVPILYLFAFLTAAAAAFDGPTRQAIIPALVPRERLPNALTLNVLSWDLAAVVGPAVGGLVIGHFGVATAFWLDAVSFLAVVVAILAMRSRPAVPVAVGGSWSALVGGLRFVRERSILWQLMLVDFLATLFVSSMGLLPVFAKDILEIGAQGLGLLFSSLSLGAVLGSLLLVVIPTVQRPGRIVVLAIGGYGLALAGFGLSSSLPLAMGFLALAGALDAVSMAMRHSVRQLATPDDLRGRVGALASVFSAGGPRLGQFQNGMMASLIGARWTMFGGGIACLLMIITSLAWARGLWSYQFDDAEASEEAPIPRADEAASASTT